MTYHLYDHQRRHLAMSDSLTEIQLTAADVFTEKGLPFAYIRWTDADGQPKEMQVSPDSIAAATQNQAPTFLPGRTVRRTVVPAPDARRRATWITGSIVFLVFISIAHVIASILLRAP
jgi:hypothetical protein